MQPANSESVIFQEAGVTITKTHIKTPSHCFAFAKLKFARIERLRTGGLPGVIPEVILGFRLVVSTHPKAKPVKIFETTDAELVKRIESAMNQAAAANKAKKVF